MKNEIITEQTLLKGLQELVESRKETDRYIKNISRQIAESNERCDRQIAESNHFFKNEMAKSNQRFKNEMAKSNHFFKNEMAKSKKWLDKEIAESNQRLDKKIAESDERMEKQNAKTNASIEKVNKLLGGIGNNQGLAAEEEFFNSLAKSMRLGNIEFHSIERNTLKRANGIQDEFDIIMTNSELIMVAEVKFKYHPKDVKKVLNKVSNFKKLYPQYQEYKIYGAVAGKILPQETIEKAKMYNLFVITQEGNNLRLLNAPI
jgi:hypothetical protein